MGSPRLKMDDVPRYEALVNAIKRAYEDVDKARYRLRDLALVVVLTYTGCRLGEALKLRVSDLDFKSKVVRIKQEKKRGEFTRLVPVPSKLFWEIMRRYVKRLAFRDTSLFGISERQARNIVYKFTKRYLRRKIRPPLYVIATRPSYSGRLEILR